MNWLIDILKEYPPLAIFLTLGIGFLIGRLKYKSFSLGSVTSVLLVGLAVGQIGIDISSQIKTLFFMMFLFSIGYSVGPGFFRSLKGSGLRQALFAVAMGSCCFGATVAVALIFGYSPGETVGLFSGSQTCSSLIGVGSEAIENGPGTAEWKQAELNIVPVCYAVTYVFGTLGTVVFLSFIAPAMMGGLDRVKRMTAQLESSYNIDPTRNDPAYVDVGPTISYRVFTLERKVFAGGMTVGEAEAMLLKSGLRLFIARVRRSAETKATVATNEMKLFAGDAVAVAGPRDMIVKASHLLGRETADRAMLNFTVKRLPVLLRSKKIVGETLGELMRQGYMDKIFVDSVTRKGADVEMTPDTRILAGDELTLVGENKSVKQAARNIGHPDRPTIHTDIMFMGLALFAGGVFGSLVMTIKGVPLSFGTGGGSLIAGLVFGWLRSRRPTYGHIPKSVLWLLNQLGLNTFIAVVGITAAPSFIEGLKSVGWALPLLGALTTLIPLAAGVLIGDRIFKFNPAITLGCCAGTRTCTASLGAVQDLLGTTLPTIGYTVTYAVSNVLLIIWGMLAVVIVG